MALNPQNQGINKFILGIGVLFLFSLSLFLEYYRGLPTDTNKQEIAEIDIIPEIIPREPEVLYGIIVDSLDVVEGKIKRNQNISEILSRYNISHQKILDLANASKKVFDVRKVKANNKYVIIHSGDSLKTAKALIYEPSKVEYVVFNLDDSVTVEYHQKQTKIIEKTAIGVIENSLALTMSELGLSPQLTNDFADVFAWQIDFFRLFPGDKFKVIYEEKVVDGETVGLGKIVGAYFQHHDQYNYAVYYDQGNGADYFNEEGKSLRKQLLKYPLSFTRISSRYTGRRYHPIIKRYRAHLGTDFAAPHGTPIRSVGEGTVTEARYSRYNGNYVKIKHNGIYSTQYLHMSKIARGIRPGAKVNKGQNIGFVGKTGLARGNHLCFRFWKNGVQVDALRIQIPPSEPITEVHLTTFNQCKNNVIARLKKLKFPDENGLLLARGNL